MRCSVIVAVRNDASGVFATLGALARQTLAADDFEVLVVDDASCDETPDVVEAHPRATLLRRADREGAYVARNRALAVASGQLVAVTDAGCRPAPTWLERGIRRLDEDARAVVGGHIAMPLGDRPSLSAMVDVIHHLDQERYIAQAGYAVTANLLATRRCFDEVGDFNETLSSSGDVEWTRRAVEAGYRLVYAREVVVVHPPRTTAREILRKSRRVARGGSALRTGRLVGGSRRPYLQRDVLIPRHRKRGRRRVRENGADPSSVRWLLVGVAQVLLLQVPQAVTALVADVRASTGRR